MGGIHLIRKGQSYTQTDSFKVMLIRIKHNRKCKLCIGDLKMKSTEIGWSFSKVIPTEESEIIALI